MEEYKVIFSQGQLKYNSAIFWMIQEGKHRTNSFRSFPLFLVDFAHFPTGFKSWSRQREKDTFRSFFWLIAAVPYFNAWNRRMRIRCGNKEKGCNSLQWKWKAGILLGERMLFRKGGILEGGLTLKLISLVNALEE